MLERISVLSDAQVKQALSALTAGLRRRAEAAYVAEPEAMSAIGASLQPGAANAALRASLGGEYMEPTARAVLEAFAAVPEFEADVRAALQQAQFVSFTGYEPWILGALITFGLLIHFKLKARRKPDGKGAEWEFEIGKDATALSFIGQLLGIGGGGTQAPKKPGRKPS